MTTDSRAPYKPQTNTEDTVRAAMKMYRRHSQILDANRNVFRAVWSVLKLFTEDEERVADGAR